MGIPSRIATLPPAERAVVDEAIVSSGFAGYDEIVERLRAERGIDISRSALARHGKRLKDTMEGLREQAMLAVALTEQVRVNGNRLPEAGLALIQSQFLDLLYLLPSVDEETDPQQRIALLGAASRAMADMARAGVTLGRWDNEQLQKRVEKLADEIDAQKGKGITEDLANDFRKQVLGLQQT